MKKLTPLEETAYANLKRDGSVLIAGDELRPDAQKLLTNIFDSLVKKRRATVEVTDGGNRYHAT